MPTDTFPIASDSDDAQGAFESSGLSWAYLIAGGFESDGTYTHNKATADLIILSKAYDPGPTYYVVWCGYLRFDTSSIPDSATITSAKLIVYVTHIGPDLDEDYAADFYDFGGGTSTSADWELTSSGDAIALIQPGDYTASTLEEIPLTGLSGINKSGYTGLRFAPLNSTAPTQDENYLNFASYENANQEPRLEVTYTVGATVTLDAAVAGTGVLTAAAVRDKRVVAAAVTGTGAVTANQAPTRGLAVVVSGTGTVTAAVVRSVRGLATAVSGLGSVIADVLILGQVRFEAAIAGVGTVTANFVRDKRALAAPVAGTGALSGALSRTQTLAASISGTGAISAGLGHIRTLAVVIAGTGAVAANVFVGLVTTVLDVVSGGRINLGWRGRTDGERGHIEIPEGGEIEE